MKESLLFERAPEVSRIQSGRDTLMGFIEALLKVHSPHKCDGLITLAECDLCELAYGDTLYGADLAARLSLQTGIV